MAVFKQMWRMCLFPAAPHSDLLRLWTETPAGGALDRPVSLLQTGLWYEPDNYFSFKCTLFGPNMFKMLLLSVTAAHTSTEYWHECRRMMCLLQMPFKNIGSVSTVESNYFFAKPN